MKTYYKECFLEQVYHFDALLVWGELGPKYKLQLSWDKEDVLYSKNIKVKSENLEFTIGILSEEDSESILPFYKSGWDLFTAIICSKEESNNDEDKRIKVVVYIADKKSPNGTNTEKMGTNGQGR